MPLAPAIPLVLATLLLAGCKPSEPMPSARTGTSAAQEETASAPAKPRETSYPLASEVERWVRETFAGSEPLLYRFANVDLDGDGENETLVYVAGPMMCGTGGCPLIVLAPGESDFRLLSKTSVVQMPFGVLDTRTDGWRDIWVTTYGGGMREATRKLVWTGEGYTANASMAAEVTAGEVLVADEDLTPID